MRRLCAASWTIACGVALASFGGGVQADGPPAPLRSQPKIIVYHPPVSGPATVAVMGQVTLPGTYQFPAAPTLGDVVQSAKGLKPAASPMVRLVRRGRVAQRLSLATAAQEKLQSGDLVIIDAQPIRDHGPQAPAAPESDGVQVALLGVADRPVVVKVRASEARLETIVAKLGQSEVAVNIIPPPNPTRTPGALPEGSVLVFDPRRVNKDGLPDDFPKIIPCGLPEQPDIGGYGIHHAIEERRMNPTPEMAAEGAIPWSSSPQPDDLTQVPLPMLDANSQASPTLIPDNRIAATWSSTNDPKNPISRVPFSSRGGIEAQRTRLTESAPGFTNGAADAREPAWNKVASTGADPVLEADAEIAGMAPAARGLSVLQIASILTSLALIGGFVAMIGGFVGTLRARPASPAQRRNSTHREAIATHTGSLSERIRVESAGAIPTPHIPIQSFTAVAPTMPAAGKIESRDERELAFQRVIQNALPMIAEPLALRPGLKISLPNSEGAIRRVDATDAPLPAPHRATAPAPHIAAARAGGTERHIIDHPHAGRVPGPHLRVGAEAPVERALRQLQGGAR